MRTRIKQVVFGCVLVLGMCSLASAATLTYYVDIFGSNPAQTSSIPVGNATLAPEGSVATVTVSTTLSTSFLIDGLICSEPAAARVDGGGEYWRVLVRQTLRARPRDKCGRRLGRERDRSFEQCERALQVAALLANGGRQIEQKGMFEPLGEGLRGRNALLLLDGIPQTNPLRLGGRELPAPAKLAMRGMARIMTTLAYRI